MTSRTSRQTGRVPSSVFCFAIETHAVWKDSAWIGSALPSSDASPVHDLDRRAGEAALLATRSRALGATGDPSWRPLPSSRSHSGGRGVAVVHRDPDRRVGIDLEPAHAVCPRFHHYFATREERVRCPFADPTVLWTLKEAAWKAFACGPSIAFHDLEITFTDHGHIRGVRLFGRETPARCLVLQPWPGWLLSVLCLEDWA